MREGTKLLPSRLDGHRLLPAILRRAPKAGKSGAESHARLAEELEDFIGPDPASHLRIPAHGLTQSAIGMQVGAVKRLRPALQDHFGEFDPSENAPRRHKARGQDLVLIVPAALVRLN